MSEFYQAEDDNQEDGQLQITKSEFKQILNEMFKKVQNEFGRVQQDLSTFRLSTIK
jgi:hypothetical protein